MTEDEFWELIEQTNDGDFGQIEANLRSALELLGDADLADFHEYFQDALGNAYTNAVWGAGYLINGGMSDDGFEYFRTWLVMQGLESYVNVVADPDSLADVPAPFGYDLEGPQYLSRELYEARTGSQPPRPGSKLGDLGPDWDFDNTSEMVKRYPRISAKVLKNPLLRRGVGPDIRENPEPSSEDPISSTSATSTNSGTIANAQTDEKPIRPKPKRPWWKFWAKS